MGETVKTEKAPKKKWIDGLKAGFKKVIWPDQKSLVRQTVAVVAISVVLCAIIAVLDAVIQMGLGFLI